MIHSPRHGWVPGLLGAAALLMGAAPAAALSPDLSLAVLAGAAKPDGAMADHQFEIGPQPAWGARIRGALGPADLGVRVWSSPNTQTLGLSGVEDPRTRTTTWDLAGRVRVAHVLGQSVHATASLGRLALTYQPSSLSIPVGGGGPPVVVALDSVHEWVTGAGLAFERGIGRQWAVDVELEHRWFGLDTAHSAGGSLVESRERFGTWDVRVGWNWIHGR